jgi:MFS family permease
MFSAMGGPALAPALPAIKAAYAPVPHIEFWTKTLLAVTGLFSAVGAPLFGWLSDRWGRKRALVAALLGWAFFGSSGMIPQPFWTLLAGRAALGLSLGGLLAANTAMIADSFGADRQRRMMGLQSAFSSSGVLLALIVSGWVAGLHWRWSFSLFLLGFAVAPLVLACPEPARRDSRPQEAVGAAPFAAGLAGLCLFAFMVLVAFTIIPTQLPFFMKQQGVHSAARMGLLLAFMPLSAAVAGRVYARVSPRLGLWNLFPFAGLAMLAGFEVLSRTTGLAHLIGGQVLVGLGCGLAMPHVNIVLARLVPQERRGRAMGLLTGSKFMGQFFSPILLQPVLVYSGYGVMFQTAGWIMLASAVTVWWRGRKAGPSSGAVLPDGRGPLGGDRAPAGSRDDQGLADGGQGQGQGGHQVDAARVVE